MDRLLAKPIDDLPQRLKLARIGHVQDLEGGTCWPQLRPYFLKPEFRSLRYAIQERTREARARVGPVSSRGASGAGKLDVAFIADPRTRRLSRTWPGRSLCRRTSGADPPLLCREDLGGSARGRPRTRPATPRTQPLSPVPLPPPLYMQHATREAAGGPNRLRAASSIMRQSTVSNAHKNLKKS